jgi:glycerol-3-phosphate dehydrogenase
MKSVDILVIGGGISGVGIARDLAGRGMKVMLCEKNDLGSATSSATSKIIHGGLSYLEYLHFGMLKDSLRERRILLHAAPHLVRPMDFVIPENNKMPKRWLVKPALFIYNQLSSDKLFGKAEDINFAVDNRGLPLLPEYSGGYAYTDCWVDDSRLVIVNAIDAQEKGALISNYTECVYVEPHPEKIGWLVTLKNNLNGKKSQLFTKIVINATGAWVNDVLDRVDRGIVSHNIRWVKGSHIIVNKLYDGDHGYTFKIDKGRNIFVTPYEGKYSLIGATDCDYTGNINKVTIDSYEIKDLCDITNSFFSKQITPKDVIFAYSGVSPILDDQGDSVSKVMKDYIIEDNEYQGAQMVSIYGGTMSSYRKLAEETADRVCAMLELDAQKLAWTATAELPGAEGCGNTFADFYISFMRSYSWLPQALASRYALSYGVRAKAMLSGAESLKDMGIYFGDNLYEREVKYLLEKEWAVSYEDILFRRTKLALHVKQKTVAKLENYLVSH